MSKHNILRKSTVIAFTTTFALTLIETSPVLAVIFGGIDFPQGESSFVDFVIQYDPLFSGGPAPTSPSRLNPNAALGVPDFTGPVAGPGSVGLGSGGLIELGFDDNVLTNSGDNRDDLHIFEIGPDVEDTFVAIRPTTATFSLLDPTGDANGDGFFEIGKVFGAISSIDIDSFFPNFNAGDLEFDAVQLIDDPNEGSRDITFIGADIDAVGAISSSEPPPPPTSTPESSSVLALLALGFLGVTKISKTLNKKKPIH